MNAPVAVQIRNLTKKIGNKTIVDDLSFDIQQGEVFGFLGPNGAGKTTTIRMMVGLISKTNGKVVIEGKDVDREFTAAMTRVGSIVENPEMYKFLTGYQNLRHFARMCQGVDKTRIDEVVRLVGLENRINEKVKRYSLGMRQRLGLAQALLRNPSVLILDEPTNGLDPAGIRELRDHLRGLARTENIAIIVSSHLLSEMELMCDRVAIIQNGKLVDVRTIRELTTGETETGQLILFEVDDALVAERVLAESFEGITLLRDESGISATAPREQIPEFVNVLVQHGVRIYGVHAKNRTLEDTFLAMTGGGPIV